jgi:hypothetical protein
VKTLPLVSAVLMWIMGRQDVFARHHSQGFCRKVCLVGSE